MHDVSVVWVGGKGIFSPRSFFCIAEQGCALTGTSMRSILMCACALHDGTLEMGRVCWHGAINSSLCMHKHHIHNKLPQKPEAMVLLFSLAFIVVISRDVITIGKIFSIYLPFLTACIPIVYIAIFISNTIWIILRIRMRCIKNNTSY